MDISTLHEAQIIQENLKYTETAIRNLNELHVTFFDPDTQTKINDGDIIDDNKMIYAYVPWAEMTVMIVPYHIAIKYKQMTREVDEKLISLLNNYKSEQETKFLQL